MIENNIPTMINNGQFGYTNPNPVYYPNPYEQQNMGNMISIGNTNYNQNTEYTYQPVQQATYENPYANVNPAVFQQYHNYYNQYNNNMYQQQPYPYSYGYDMNYQYNGPFQTAPASQYGYVDPTMPSYQQTQLYDVYANMNHMKQEQTNNVYGYGQYQSYQQQYLQSQQEQLRMLRMKMEIACAVCHRDPLNEEEFDKRFNPENPANKLSDEEVIQKREFENMKQLNTLFVNPPMEDTPGMSIAKHISRISSSYHQYFDSMSMREFLDNHLWRLKREWWIQDNINLKQQHDLSTTYSSQAYNELLGMHQDSNSYLSQILNNSRYDNNIDDTELGLKEALDLERRKREILEGRVPQFISSNEAIQARNQWTNAILGQIAKKNERKSNQDV